MFDTHCHLQFKAFRNDLTQVISRCAEKNMIMNVVGTQKDTSQKAVELAEEHENIYATIGLHPIQEYKTKVKEEETEFISRGEEFDGEFYEELVKSEKVIAIGETGLDKFHVPKDKSLADVMQTQKNFFVQHYNFAKKHDLPLVIHVREAHDEMIDLLQSVIARSDEGATSQSLRQRDFDVAFQAPRNDSKINGVMHCFGSNWDNAQKYLDMGLYLGFTGVITFPPKKTDPKLQEDLLEVIKKMPLDKILVETDAPFLAPQKYRGKRCEPWMVEEVVKKIAQVRNLSVEEVKEITMENSLHLFKRIQTG